MKNKIIIIAFLIICIAEGIVIYAQSKIESNVILPSFQYTDISKNYPEFEDNYITAKGSWVSDTKLANPLQTVELTCDNSLGYCEEVIGELFDNKLLTVSSTSYKIAVWTKDKIVTDPESTAAGCVNYIITIDRKLEQVTSLRTSKNTKTTSCGILEDKPIVSKLEDGLNRIINYQK